MQSASSISEQTFPQLSQLLSYADRQSTAMEFSVGMRPDSPTAAAAVLQVKPGLVSDETHGPQARRARASAAASSRERIGFFSTSSTPALNAICVSIGPV